MAVQRSHEVVRLVVADGPTVLASPGHPLPEARPVAAPRAGDACDGSIVVSADRLGYDGARTFNLLSSGRTGVEGANAIEL